MTTPFRPISRAIRQGTAIAPHRSDSVYLLRTTNPWGSCPLGAAFLGSLRMHEVDEFYERASGLSDTSLTEYVTNGLLRAFPYLWASVRFVPKFAEAVEAIDANLVVVPKVLPTVRKYADVYRQAIHPSLFSTITKLHKHAGLDREQLSSMLRECGL